MSNSFVIPDQPMIAYGPVPSRRLGRSLGVNNIPPKICSYSCVYCQLGRTRRMEINPRFFYPPEEIVKAVSEKIALAEREGESVDYLSFVPDGEPTLDNSLGETIDLLRSATGKKIAVITNSSLISQSCVQADLMKADWVSLKIDSVDEEVWRKIDRPHRSLALRGILAGIESFAGQFKGTLVTETMLIRDVNDSKNQIEGISDFIQCIPVKTSYLSIPTRPPAEKWVTPPAEETLIQAYEILRAGGSDVEYLIGYEGNAFAFTGNAEKDLLSITSVHPMREEAVSEFLKKADAKWSVVIRLIENGLMVKKNFQGVPFYARTIFPKQDA